MLRKQVMVSDYQRSESSNHAIVTVNTTNLEETTQTLFPPFKVFQYGKPRTASTFQFQLLQAIVSWKSPPNTDVKIVFARNEHFEDIQEVLSTNGTFLVKTHYLNYPEVRAASKAGKVSVFASSNEFPHSLYVQDNNRLRKCSTCEVDNYAPFFGLNTHEVTMLKDHMSDFAILRQCCGLQMSKYEVLRLHGCNVAPYKNKPEYPHCERHNLTAVETKFATSPVPFVPLYPDLNWARPGDCARFQAMVADGKGFNGRNKTDCSLRIV